MPVIGVSIAVPEPWGTELQRARLSFGDEQAHSIPTHVTVLPPTEIPEERLQEVHEHLVGAAADVAPFDLELRGTGTFLPVSPVVFVQVARGIPLCERLESRVRSGILERDLAFTYHPHVTVAHGIPEDALEKAYADLAGYRCRFLVEEIFLYVQGDDEVWRPVQRYRLGGQAG